MSVVSIMFPCVFTFHLRVTSHVSLIPVQPLVFEVALITSIVTTLHVLRPAFRPNTILSAYRTPIYIFMGAFDMPFKTPSITLRYSTSITIFIIQFFSAKEMFV